MLLKFLAEGVEAVDNDPHAECCLIDDVQQVRLVQASTGESILRVSYRIPVNDSLNDNFVINNTTFLMNDHGKTIQTFSPKPKNSK